MKTRGILFFLALSFSLLAQTSVTVTNTNDSGAGSLRQAIIDANGNWNIDHINFNIPITDPNYNSTTGVFTIKVSSGLLPVVRNRYLIIDGSTQTAFTGNTNTTLFGIGGTVGVDAINLPQVDGPEIEIIDDSPNKDLVYGLEIGERQITIKHLAINGFGNDWFIFNHANILVRGGGHDVTIHDCVLGSDAHIDQAPAGDVTGGPNMQALGVDNGTFYHNYVAYSETMGGFLRSGCRNWNIYENDFNFNGLDDRITDGLDVANSCENTTVQANMFRNNGGNGFDTYLTLGGHTIINNTAYNNGIKGRETNGMRIYGSVANTIEKNLIYDNVGAGIMITSDARLHRITENSIYNNGNIVPNMGATTTSNQIGIDLLDPTDDHEKGTSPFITINDNGDGDNGGNNLINFPVIDAVIVNGNNLTIKGFAAAGATVEFFKGDLFTGAIMPQGKTFLFSKVEGSVDDNDNTTGSYGPGLVNGVNQGAESGVNRFEFTVPKPNGFSVGDILTATAYTAATGTSEFCSAFTAVSGGGNTPIVPNLNCVYIDVNGDIVARFGYANANNNTVNIPFGSNNEFVPSPQDRGQGTSFQAGTHSGQFEVTFPAANTLTWNLDGSSVTADINTVRCPADLEVTQTVTNNTPNTGDNVTFTITINNLTQGTPATAVDILYTIHPNLTFVIAGTPSSGSYNASTGIWTIPEVVFGTPQTLTITAQVNGNGTNVASVQSQNQPDPVSSNNSASETIATGSSGSNNGGIESDGSMATLIAKRNFNRIKTGAHTFYDRIDQAPRLSEWMRLGKTNNLSSYIPPVGPQNAPAIISSPRDLIGITNALDVFSVDYLNAAQNRLAGILAIETQNDVYNHTKVICDRLNGASLNDIKTVSVKGHTFIMARLDQEDGTVDMAITFVAYKKANGDFIIDARWNQDDYQIQTSDKVYNFQVWSVSESLTRDLVEDVISLMENDGPVSSITSSNVTIPTVYVKSGHYENGSLTLNMVNTVGASRVDIESETTVVEDGVRTPASDQVSMDPSQSLETITWNPGYLFDSGFEIVNNKGGGKDVLYIADGPWGADFEANTGVTGSVFDVYQETGYSTVAGERHLERDIHFAGNLKNYVSIYRMLRPGHRTTDLSAYNQVTFDASLAGMSELIVTLVSGEITNWSEQYRVTLPIQNAAMGSYSIDFADLQSAGSKPLDLSKIVSITFSVVGDYSSFQSMSLDIENVTFTDRGKGLNTAELYANQEGLNVYPNPFSGAAHIDINLEESSEVYLELYDLSGKMVDGQKLGSFFSGTNTAVYQPHTELPEGVYLMKVISDKRSYTQRVVYRK